MQVTEIELNLLRQAPWNPNVMDVVMAKKLGTSVGGYGIVENLVVRPLGDESFEMRLHG